MSIMAAPVRGIGRVLSPGRDGAVARTAIRNAMRTSPRRVPNAPTATLTTQDRGRVGLPSTQLFRNWAEHSEWVRAALNMRRDQVANAEWVIDAEDHDKPWSRTAADEITALLRNPNPVDEQWRTFIQAVVEDVLVLDAGAVEKERTLRGRLAYLHSVDGATIRVNKWWDGDPDEPRYHWYPDYQERASFKNSDLVYLRANPMTYRVVGLAPLETLRLAVDAELSGQSYNTRQIKAPAPDGILDLGEQARPDQVDDFKCYADDTEFLTEDGWKAYDEVGPSDRLAMVDDAGELSHALPSERFQAPYRGQMVHIHGQRGVDLLVTPNHQVVLSDRSGGRMRFAEAGSLLDHGDLTIPVAASAWNCAYPSSVVLGPAVRRPTQRGDVGHHPRAFPPIPMMDWLEFVGYLVSEGYVQEADQKPYVVGLSQNVGPKADRMQACLSRLPFMVGRQERHGKVGWRIYSKTLWEWARSEAGIGIGARRKRIPRALLALDRPHLQVLFDALMLGDGHWKGDHAKYTTTSERLAGDVQEMAIKLGRRAIISDVANRKGDRWFDVHMPNRLTARALSIRSVEWDGRVVCFTVPTGRLVVRRNGHAAICGNSYWNAEVAGRGAMAFLGGTKGAQFLPFRQNNRDMQFLEYQMYLARKIAAVFGMSIADLGVPMDTNRATAAVSSENTDDRGLRPLLGLIQAYVTLGVVKDESFGGRTNNLTFAFTALNLKESLSRAQRNRYALGGMPWTFIDEARREDGRPPIGGTLGSSLLVMGPKGPMLLTEGEIPTAREALESGNKPAPAVGSSPQAASDTWPAVTMGDSME